MRQPSPLVASFLLAGIAALAAGAAMGAPAPADDVAAFRDLYRELVETNTTLSVGSCTKAAELMAARLRAAGLPASNVEVFVPPGRPSRGSLVATYPGRNRALKPILLLAHIDVVEARRDDWTRDPFKLVEEGGFFYGRGASDDKAMAAVFTDLLIRFQREGYRPGRDVRLALTCGEETPEDFNGVQWLLAERPQLMQARLVLNEGAGGSLDADGRHVTLEIQAGEKVYQDFRLETLNPGGHSSRPVPKNAITELSAGLVRLGAYQFPARLNGTTRAYFEAQAKLASSPQVASDLKAILADPNDAAAAARLWADNPGWNSMLRTTCVTTQVDAGHAPNALPQRARANVNCRILPDEPVENVRAEIRRVLADEGITVTPVGDPGQSCPVPPLTESILAPVRAVSAKLWPGVTVVPTMSTGATDGRFLNAAGVPTYGLSGMFHDTEGSHAHGLNERIRVQSLLDGREFLNQVVRRYAALMD